MIVNLAAYNSHKRGTLDRVAAKYRNLFLKVFEAHLRRLTPQIIHSLDNGLTDIDVAIGDIDGALARVLIEHFNYTVKVAVSDGWREVSPDKQLNAWAKFPIGFPIEDTFTNLAEKKKRDSILDDLMKKIRQKYGSSFAEIISLEKERYLKNVKSVYRTIADSYFKDPESDYTDAIAKDVISRVFDKTKVQAEMIFRTETTSYFNDARVNYFQDNTDVDFLMVFAVTDGRISEICEHRSKFVLPVAYGSLKRFKPPYHPNCRSILSPLISYLASDANLIKINLGSEFGRVEIEHDKDNVIVFTGRRQWFETEFTRKWA